MVDGNRKHAADAERSLEARWAAQTATDRRLELLQVDVNRLAMEVRNGFRDLQIGRTTVTATKPAGRGLPARDRGSRRTRDREPWRLTDEVESKGFGRTTVTATRPAGRGLPARDRGPRHTRDREPWRLTDEVESKGEDRLQRSYSSESEDDRIPEPQRFNRQRPFDHRDQEFRAKGDIPIFEGETIALFLEKLFYGPSGSSTLTAECDLQN